MWVTSMTGVRPRLYQTGDTWVGKIGSAGNNAPAIVIAVTAAARGSKLRTELEGLVKRTARSKLCHVSVRGNGKGVRGGCVWGEVAESVAEEGVI